MSPSEPAAVEPTAAPPDRRMVPIAAASWAVAGLATSGVAWAWPVLGVVGVAALVWGIAPWRIHPRGGRRPWGVALALVTLAMATSAGVRAAQLDSSVIAGHAEAGAMVEVEVQVGTDPSLSSSNRPVVVVRGDLVGLVGRGEGWRAQMPVLLLASSAHQDWLAVPAGATVRTWARARPADRGDGLAAVLIARQPPELVHDQGPVDRAVDHFRATLRAAVSAEPADRRALLPALVVGDTSQMSGELGQVFEATGLTHLNAVSGANLALFLAFALTAARWIGVRGWPLRLIGVACVVAFVLVCRTEPSVLRAAAMGLVTLAALGQGSDATKGLRHLSVAAVGLLIIDPWLSRSAGFAMSALASGAIIWCARPWQQALRRWLPGWVAEAVTVPLSAQLVTQPIVTGLSGAVSMVGIICNALAGPLVGPATVLGLSAGALGLVFPIGAAFLGWVGGWCAQGIIWIARAGAALPGATWTWPTTAVGLAVLSACCLALLVGMPLLLRRPVVVIALALLVMLAGIRAPLQPGWPPQGWRIVACDVGQGDATVLWAGSGSAVVVDVGPEPQLLDRCLTSLGVRSIPVLVLTHYHDDHVGGLAGIGDRGVGMVLVSPLASPAAAARAVAAWTERREIPVQVARVDQRWDAGAVDWRTLSVGPPVVQTSRATGESPGENNASIVAVATVDRISVLLTGDIEPEAQRLLVGNPAATAVVLKVPHHGSGNHLPEFFRHSGASLALIGVGADNTFGHPAARTLTTLRTGGMTVLRTDLHGSIALSRDDHTIRVRTQRQENP
ncbi:ComEC/Rec2 family competence protein [Parenemella sanctibonifatiensis]|uniref:Competence protein ComEC n=1 Tax=Parenemella sanctibonifatiensis TaxID=2016505 RepID=A0A255E120_9ACTN|nr:ComEC/Rec2 family competence protein [Parenemella sanctibonifatiensis]OYN85258.1 competence protein ComEC [Parenemella sanctibonifatiensis]